MLHGERVTLRLLSERDLPERVLMCGNEEIQRMMSGQAPDKKVSLEDMKKWYRTRENEANSVEFAIEFGGKYIGDIDLHSIDKERHTAGIIPMIGYQELWGKGLGTEALEILKKYAKDQLNLKRLTLEVLPFNERAIKAYKKLGFKIDGETDNKELIMSIDL
jgi:RimJ/RimL family protein N-acetyltransferase